MTQSTTDSTSTGPTGPTEPTEPTGPTFTRPIVVGPAPAGPATPDGGGADAGPRLIVGVVERGQADAAVSAAIRAGAQAATVFIGRGAEAEQRVGASGLAVRSEIEVIVTVVGGEIAGSVARAIGGAVHGGPGGYVAKMPVARVVGLLEAVAMAKDDNGQPNSA